MSDSSGVSIGSSKGRYGSDGIPERCWCENGIVMRMSKTEQNPSRRYFRCELAYANKMMNDNHLFKWIDEALIFEVKNLKRDVDALKEEIKENQKVMEVVLAKVEFDLLEAKKERVNFMKKMVFVMGFGFLLIIGVTKLA